MDQAYRDKKVVGIVFVSFGAASRLLKNFRNPQWFVSKSSAALGVLFFICSYLPSLSWELQV
jgi:hypothetical protein